MQLPIKQVALGSLYLIWFGAGIGVYSSYPSISAYANIFMASFFTVTIYWYLKRIDSKVNVDLSTESAQHLRKGLHICLNPNECSRCSGFYITFFPSMLVAITAHGLVSRLLNELPIRPLFIFMFFFGVFLLAVGGHGLLNGLQKENEVERIPDWLFTNPVKMLFGMVAGLSVALMGVSGLLLLIRMF